MRQLLIRSKILLLNPLYKNTNTLGQRCNYSDMADAPNAADLGDLRKPYSATVLLESTLTSKNPSSLFHDWFEQVKLEGLTFEEVNATCLSTVASNGKPSSRMVLLKAYSPEGFSFYTNYDSRKGLELAENANACLLMYWPKVNRQVRIEGQVAKLSAATADEYWARRPVQSTASAAASRQSHPVSNREVLEQQRTDVMNSVPEGGKLARPEHWGGYILVPEYWEFWQGQSDRLHDRIIFRRPTPNESENECSHQGEDGWVYERLAP